MNKSFKFILALRLILIFFVITGGGKVLAKSKLSSSKSNSFSVATLASYTCAAAIVLISGSIVTNKLYSARFLSSGVDDQRRVVDDQRRVVDDQRRVVDDQRRVKENILPHEALHAELKSLGLKDLETLWDEEISSLRDKYGEQDFVNALKDSDREGSASVSKKIKSDIKLGLDNITKKINSSSQLPSDLKEALSSYFQPDAIIARRDEDGDILVDLPLTPIAKVVNDDGTVAYMPYKLSQGDLHAYGQSIPSDSEDKGSYWNKAVGLSLVSLATMGAVAGTYHMINGYDSNAVPKDDLGMNITQDNADTCSENFCDYPGVNCGQLPRTAMPQVTKQTHLTSFLEMLGNNTRYEVKQSTVDVSGLKLTPSQNVIHINKMDGQCRHWLNKDNSENKFEGKIPLIFTSNAQDYNQNKTAIFDGHHRAMALNQCANDARAPVIQIIDTQAGSSAEAFDSVYTLAAENMYNELFQGFE